MKYKNLTTHIDQLITVEGLAGTGKTNFIDKECRRELKRGNTNIRYITFNRKTANSARERLPDIICTTIHSIVYHELLNAGELPLKFNKSEPFDGDYISDKDWNQLLKQFLNHFKAPVHTFCYLTDGLLLFVDEYQNVIRSLKKVLKLITKKIWISKLYLIGDRFQDIYSYTNKNEPLDNFETIEDDFCHAIDDKHYLKHNYRSPVHIQLLINSFVDISLKAGIQYQYEISNSKKSTEKVPCLFFNHQKEEFIFVTKEIQRIWETDPMRNIVILGRSKPKLPEYKNWKSKLQLSSVQVSSVHAFSGNDVDTVFIVGMEEPNTEEEKRILYCALSRSKNKLFIVTSFPFFDLTKYLDQSLLDVTNYQKQLSVPYDCLPIIRKRKKLTYKKFNDCGIDSIILKVSSEFVPFTKYVYRQVKGTDNTGSSIRQSKFMSEHIEITKDNIQINVSVHHRTGSYFFEITDVNILRMSNYCDDDVIRYLLNFIFLYFDYRLPVENIAIHSIHICRAVKIDNNFMKNFCSGKYDTYKSLWNEKKSISYFGKDSIMRHSVYFNYTSSNSKALTLAVYRPFDKENKNRYEDPDIVKFEFRLKGKSLKAHYALGRQIDALSLIMNIEQNKKYIQNAFNRILASRIKKIE